jgi:hypothetical protein
VEKNVSVWGEKLEQILFKKFGGKIQLLPVLKESEVTTPSACWNVTIVLSYLILCTTILPSANPGKVTTNSKMFPGEN